MRPRSRRDLHGLSAFHSAFMGLFQFLTLPTPPQRQTVSPICTAETPEQARNLDP